MRNLTHLPILLFLCSCTVVPDPTSAGTKPATTNSGLIGNWVATTMPRGTTSHLHTLTLSAKAYQRWSSDSVPGMPSQVVLIERGTWSEVTTDTLRLIPAFHQTTPQTLMTPITIATSWKGDTLQWILPNWQRADTLDTLKWRRE